MNKTINQYKLKLNEKEKEISKLKEKELSLNKKATTIDKKQNINNSYSVNREHDNSKSIINMFNKEILGLSPKNIRKFPIKIINRNNISKSKSQSNFYTPNKNKKYNSNITSLLSNNLNNSDRNKTNEYSLKKTKESNYSNNIINYCNNYYKKNINNNSRNIKRKNKNIGIYKVSNNITNINYNIQKNNNSLINIKRDKLKIQQILEAYLKMIEKKLNNLKKKKKIG